MAGQSLPQTPPARMTSVQLPLVLMAAAASMAAPQINQRQVRDQPVGLVLLGSLFPNIMSMLLPDEIEE